jgi:hypothetical protein
LSGQASPRTETRIAPNRLLGARPSPGPAAAIPGGEPA